MAMTTDTKNVKLGVCSITFAEDNLGLTKGGVEAEVATTTQKITVDQFGDTEIDEVIRGRTVKVRTQLAETTLDRLVAIMPGATLVTDAVDATKKRVDVPTGIGISLLGIAQKLQLHPIANAADNKGEDFIVWKAATAGAITYAFSLDNERVFNVEFTGYVDTENGNRLFSVGDDSVAE